MMYHAPNIIPAILVHSEQDALTQWAQIVEAEIIQLDCLDGRFVPNNSFYDPTHWPKEGPKIELHVMCEHPLEVMQMWDAHPLLKRVIWHVEAPVSHKELIAWCRERELGCGIALNPETPLNLIASFALQIDLVLLLGVHPGWSGQPFIPTTLEKVRQTHDLYPFLSIGVDGGVSEDLIPLLSSLGATDLYVGSGIFGSRSGNPAEALHHLSQVAHDNKDL